MMSRLLPALRLALLLAGTLTSPARADETCMSPYMPKIEGQEEFVYVWTLGQDGVGDASDKLVTVDVRPDSETYGEVLHAVSVGGQHEAHHGGFTDDRRELWVAGLDSSRIFIFDVHTDASEPKLARTIDDFVEASGGAVGPHGVYALPGRVLISCLSNANDKSGRTAIVEYTNSGQHLATYWMPTDDEPRGAKIESVADGYGYDLRALPRKNAMLTSSFTGWNNYMTELGTVVGDAERMKRFGQTVTVWDLHTRQPRQVLHVPGAPLEIRAAWEKGHDWAFTATALTSKLWLIHPQDDGTWDAKAVADIGDPSKMPLPVDISLSADDSTLFVSCFMEGAVRVFDVSDPHHPREIHRRTIGDQVNMVSQSWDGERLYFTSSLLAKWDKTDGEQYLRAFRWDGSALTPTFEVDFEKAALGRPHIMRFGSSRLRRATSR